MKMIKKIAFTASILLFVLAQIFSFYVIYVSHREKIKLLSEKEGKYFSDALQKCFLDLRSINQEAAAKDYVIIYYFRRNMMQNTAIYKGTEELYNNSPYEFDINHTDWSEYQYPAACRTEKIGGRYLLVLYQSEELGRYHTETDENEMYYFYYVLDITSVYEESFSLIVRELMVSLLFSAGMAALLVYLIKKITKPLQAVNETQRQLIGSLSHELKTPLTAMKGYSETLLGVKLSEEQKERALLYINRESGRLSRLSEKMMELTRLYEPECSIMLTEVSVEDLFDAVRESVGHRLSEKNLTLVQEGEYRGKTKKMDVDLMTSFLINLINNSIMASAEGGRIYIGADENSLWVRDEGCGIPPEEVEKVRKAFYRVDKSRSRKSGNMGLGLSLCEQIAAVHHGSMEIVSKAGEGTKISLIFFTKH